MPDHGLVKPVRETANEIRDRQFAQDSGRQIAERVNAQFRAQLAAHRAMINAEKEQTDAT